MKRGKQKAKNSKNLLKKWKSPPKWNKSRKKKEEVWKLLRHKQEPVFFPGYAILLGFVENVYICVRIGWARRTWYALVR